MTNQSDKFWTADWLRPLAKISKTVYDELVKTNLLAGFTVLFFLLLNFFFNPAFTPKVYAVCSEGTDKKGNIITEEMIGKDPKRESDIVKCLKVNTAIGTISTEPQGFVRFIYSVVLGLAGGIALIMIILSGYKFMSSAGNPEATKAAGEQLTSAIIGLVFIIFAFVILQIVGVDILRIPGFKP